MHHAKRYIPTASYFCFFDSQQRTERGLSWTLLALAYPNDDSGAKFIHYLSIMVALRAFCVITWIQTRGGTRHGAGKKTVVSSIDSSHPVLLDEDPKNRHSQY